MSAFKGILKRLLRNTLYLHAAGLRHLQEADPEAAPNFFSAVYEPRRRGWEGWRIVVSVSPPGGKTVIEALEEAGWSGLKTRPYNGELD